jgi:hypothetical protein
VHHHWPTLKESYWSLLSSLWWNWKDDTRTRNGPFQFHLFQKHLHISYWQNLFRIVKILLKPAFRSVALNQSLRKGKSHCKDACTFPTSRHACSDYKAHHTQEILLKPAFKSVVELKRWYLDRNGPFLIHHFKSICTFSTSRHACSDW